MDAASFLADLERRPLSFPEAHALTAGALVLGRGPNALEVVVVQAQARPASADLRGVWLRRLGGRASPLLIVAFYDDLVAICGPAGDPPPVAHDILPQTAERICRAGLDEPDRHAALRFLQSVLPEIDSPLLGLRNEGLLATHELVAGVPARPDWATAGSKAVTVLHTRGEDLLRALGFAIERTAGPYIILRADGTRTALAILLDRTEAPELPGPLFSGLSPIAHAMAKADEERVPYVLMLAGSMLRLYSVYGGGVGRRGRTETFVEVRLDVLREDQAAYIWLLLSVDALRDGGTVGQILEQSRDYAADLGKRLRERIHAHVIPELATGLMAARQIRSPSVDDLATTYQVALMLLFRLLLVAYAEDKGLLPYRTNDLYRRRSLKQKARELLTVVESKESFSEGTTHWEEAQRLFRAVDKGMREWGVPEYNGGLFSSDPSVSPVGAALDGLSLNNTVLGPVLIQLLLDQTEEGWGPVDFRSLGVREFGTIYEGLLENELSVAQTDLTLDASGEYRPLRKASEAVVVRQGNVYLHSASGARKTSGSFFTKQFAVEHLLDHALEPALADHLTRLNALDDQAAGKAFF